MLTLHFLCFIYEILSCCKERPRSEISAFDSSSVRILIAQQTKERNRRELRDQPEGSENGGRVEERIYGPKAKVDCNTT